MQRKPELADIVPLLPIEGTDGCQEAQRSSMPNLGTGGHIHGP
ncbi:MAG: hypothetical protein ACLS9K_08670 [Lachnospira eligens]